MTQQITINAPSPPLSTAPATFASQPSFTQKLLNFLVSVPSDAQNNQITSFAEAQSTAQPGTYNFLGYRSRVRISNASAPSASFADISIYGLSQSLMNQLATLGVVINSVSKNSIIVSAGASSVSDASSLNAVQVPPTGFPVVFGGTFWFAFGDYNSMPDVPFRITAYGGLIDAVQSAAPSSFTGPTSIVSIMQGFAQKLGVPFENNGVTGSISNPYFPGTLLQQLYQAAEHAFIHAQLVDGGTKLAIWPIGGSRTSQTNVPLISPDTGMIGYPSFAQNGFLVVKMVFNPDVVLGGNIRVQSDIPQANKTWNVFSLDLALDSLIPDGDWMATAVCQPVGVNAGVPPAVKS
jgi:hypothetical protein